MNTPYEMIKNHLPKIMDSVMQMGVRDPQLLFMAVGDHEYIKKVLVLLVLMKQFGKHKNSTMYSTFTLLMPVMAQGWLNLGRIYLDRMY